MVLILLVTEQMVVIFRYSNVIVNRHKFVAHFAFMESTLIHPFINMSTGFGKSTIPRLQDAG